MVYRASDTWKEFDRVDQDGRKAGHLNSLATTDSVLWKDMMHDHDDEKGRIVFKI
jgi:hypothetical protein